MNDDDGYERGKMVSLDRFQVTQHHNQPALQGKKQSARQAYPLAHQLFTFPNLISSPSHPFSSSPHISTPSYLRTCISSKGTCFASPLHTLQGFSSPMSTAQSEEKHFCLQHAMYSSINALSPCFSPGTAQYVGKEVAISSYTLSHLPPHIRCLRRDASML